MTYRSDYGVPDMSKLHRTYSCTPVNHQKDLRMPHRHMRFRRLPIPLTGARSYCLWDFLNRFIDRRHESIVCQQFSSLSFDPELIVAPSVALTGVVGPQIYQT